MRREMYKLDSSGKFVTQYNGQSVVLGGTVYSNPPDDILWAAGYRPIGQGVMPEYDLETQCLEITGYFLNDDQTEIIPMYEVVALPSIEIEGEAEPTVEQRVADLEEALELLLSGVVE